MKKQIVSVLAAMCLTAAVATPSFAEMTVSTDGSTSMEKVIGSLGEAFSNKYDDVTFTYNPTGSGSGITAAQEGRCDIGLSSRALKADEAKTLDGTTLALDGIVVVVNPANKVNDLSIDQISKIFKGEVTSWKDVGGADTPIVLIGREAGSGTRDGFETITNTKDSCKYRQELTSTGDVMTVVSKNENAIGYISLASMNDKVKGVTVEGVAATEPTIADGTYKIQRPFVLVTKKGAQLSEGAQKFIDFAFSEEAKPILIKAGVVPVAKK
ncbi:phosphate ABC transporter substrate-binding protein [Succinatimonas hippei]|uniref:Phosphate-binding protein n=1 Tax=Succinatimonas hippei (strain DSM 22608 / JCM 16073 / KCTC 15190 / YIT 12066) TaxID=762983 RepID=E8LI15_SUCHY|nr:phosphate ABC transporter substrate-binding protein [Succinatimonas hippei]EFY07836.1 phosphate binding protein [Succinatimonas hippei YIT 12066]MCL1604065.1 phosphate ABC transporter substrate-binding protein [Succinatimonas hippei]MDM8120323.1 phosphate ABC transporter substrate-binding protein [Succinatimonas hippei]